MPMPFRRERRRSVPLLRPTAQYGPGDLNPNANGTMLPLGLGPADFKPSQPRGGDPRRRIILPGCDFPPADAIAVDEIGDGDIAAAVTQTLVTVVVPDNLTFRISGIGFGADDESSLRFLTWTITATPPGVPIPGYVNKPAAVGSIPQVSNIFSVQGSSVTIRVDATNNNLVTLHYVCRLQGWFYAEREG